MTTKKASGDKKTKNPSLRLNQANRELIIHRVLTEKFLQPISTKMLESNDMVDSIYESSWKPEEWKLLHQLPEKWVNHANAVMVRYDGTTRRIFKYWKVQLDYIIRTDQYNRDVGRQLFHSLYPEIKHNHYYFSDLPKKVAEEVGFLVPGGYGKSDCTSLALTVPATNKDMEKWVELCDEIKKLEEECCAVASTIWEVLNSVTTLNRLTEVWPESAQFTAGLENNSSTSVPAITLENLNKKLGL